LERPAADNSSLFNLVKVRMVTGDNINTAEAIARECGILTDGVAIQGPRFREMNPEEMRQLIPNLQVTSPMGLHCS
jgi:Ca2+-transporting ATPase